MDPHVGLGSIFEANDNRQVAQKNMKGVCRLTTSHRSEFEADQEIVVIR
jgi:hypothetical protein